MRQNYPGSGAKVQVAAAIVCSVDDIDRQL